MAYFSYKKVLCTSIYSAPNSKCRLFTIRLLLYIDLFETSLTLAEPSGKFLISTRKFKGWIREFTVVLQYVNDNYSKMYRKLSKRLVNICYQQMTGDLSEMKELASRICRDYLHGAWKFVNAQNICVKHVRWEKNSIVRYNNSKNNNLMTGGLQRHSWIYLGD